MFRNTLIIILLAVVTISQSQFVDVIINGDNNYTSFYTGNVNLLLSIPHDGTLQPSNISNRTNDTLGNFLRDTNTFPMGLRVRDKLTELFTAARNTTSKVFAVRNALHRVKMEPNREQGGCCQSTSEASYPAYNQYHNFIRQNFYQNFIVANGHTRGLLIDLHGQNHPEKRIELGYLFSAAHLNSTTTLTDRNRSSVCKLAARSNYTLNELIRGNVSLGAILERRFSSLNATALPSPRFTKPNLEEYYSGGFIVQEYGSRYCNGSIVDAIQIELPNYIRTSADYLTHADTLAAAIFEYYNLHY